MPWAGTFHSVGLRLIREYADRLELPQTFTIHDRSDSADLMDLVRQELGLGRRKGVFPGKDTCLEIYSLAVNSGRLGKLRGLLRERFPKWAGARKPLRRLFKAYQRAKAAQKVLDFDDLLLKWAELLTDPDVASTLRRRFVHVLVDEYQDTNILQAKILRKLKPDGRGLMVVGDDAQSIYRFRGAEIRNIRCFPDQFAARARITLERNYRSTKPILKACNRVMGLASEGFKKKLWSKRRSEQKPLLTTVVDDAAQAQHVVEQLIRARKEGTPLIEQATLFRNSRESAGLEAELTRRGIPFVKYGGLKFLEAAHVKDVLSVLRWCENLLDQVAGFRALRLLPAVGPATAASILAEVRKRPHVSKLPAQISVPAAAKLQWSEFVKLVHQLRARKVGWPAELRRVRRWYKLYLRSRYHDVATRSKDLDLLEDIAADYGTRAEFLANLTLDPPDETPGPGAEGCDDYTVLSTIHSAKGQEWKVVRVLNVVDGCIPSGRAKSPEEIEEERRLLHVAMTRACDELDLIVPYRTAGRLRRPSCYVSRTQFIPRSIERAFEIRKAPVMRPQPKSVEINSAAEAIGASGVASVVALNTQ